MAADLSQDMKDKIFRQVEFYFSDSNLPKDNFLKKQVAQNPDGYVDLALICSFARMRDYLKLESNDPDAIPDSTIQAVAEILKPSELLEVSEDGLQVKRKEPLGAMDEVSKQVDSRSVYARPFPITATLDEITAFFGKQGTVKCVRQRRHTKSKDFKGSVFVELESEEEAARVAGLKGLEYEGAPLTLIMKEEYLKTKEEERKQGGKENAEADSDVDATLKKSTVDGVQIQGKKRAREEGPEGGEGDANGEQVAAAPAGGKEEFVAEVDTFTPGCLVHWQWPEDADVSKVNPFIVKESIGKEKLRFVEFRVGEKKGVLRFREASEAAAFVEEAGKQPEEERLLAGFKAEYEVLSGDAEKEYYQRADDKRKEMQDQGGNRGRGGRRGGRFSGRGGRGGRFGNKRGRR